MAMRWYVVQAYSGFEQQVRRSLLERINRAGINDQFGQILVPTEEVVEMRDGQKRKSDRKFFPGYVLVQMELDNETWHLVRETPKVLGFIGGTSDKTSTDFREGSSGYPATDSGWRRQAQTQGALRTRGNGARH